jgi:hypothetical protein
LSQGQGGENTTPQIPTSPQKCCRRAQAQTERVPELSGSKFIKQAGSDPMDLSPKAEPENKGGAPYIPFRAGHRNGGGQLVPYMVAYYFIGCSTSGAR